MLLFTVMAAGCGSPSPAAIMPPSSSPAPTTFDPANSGTVTGRVTWAGPIPAREMFLYGVPKPDGNFDIRPFPNPNTPDVEPTTQAVRGAVVFLRGVDPTATKPWDLPPVRVELRDRQIVVKQGDDVPRRAGFVRRGDAVSIVSAEPVFHVLRGRGGDFFALAFPDPDRPLTRNFDRAGRVELTSGAGYYWANADLFVTDHPYFTLTDADGRFTLSQVPAGPVQVVVWLPGSVVVKKERDPESGLFTRQTYAPPREVTHDLAVQPGRSTEANVGVP